MSRFVQFTPPWLSTFVIGLVASITGCQTGGQTGALTGAGIGALAGQAIGGDTGAQLGPEVMARFVFYNWNGGDVDDYIADPVANPFDQFMPEEGTVFRFTTLKPNQPGDSFTFNTTGFGVMPASAELKKEQLKEIGMVPNPYKGVSLYERSQLIDEVRFTNLLSDETTISIFSLRSRWPRPDAGTH